LRHTNITQLLKAGVDVGTVSNNAGHASKTMTLDYDGPDAEALREVAHKANDIFDLDNIVPALLGQPTNIYRKKEEQVK
jgi:integrase